MHIWQSTEKGPGAAAVDEIAAGLARGGVFILPTDTLYGFHGRAADREAIEAIIAIKGRDERKPMVVLAASIAQLRGLGARVGVDEEATLGSIWPAPLTAVLPLEREVAASAGAPTVAARIPAMAWLRELLERCGPLASTSVNRSGERPFYSTESIPPEIRQRVDGIVDAGPLEGAPSTIVDFTVTPPRVLREGAFGFTQNLWKTSRKTL